MDYKFRAGTTRGGGDIFPSTDVGRNITYTAVGLTLENFKARFKKKKDEEYGISNCITCIYVIALMCIQHRYNLRMFSVNDYSEKL